MSNSCLKAFSGLWCAAVFLGISSPAVWASSSSPAQTQLAAEVRGKGWIAYGARSSTGDWDLFACRPNGAHVHTLTATPQFNEFSPQFSRDGRQLLYRRIGLGEKIDNNRHGEQGELVLARADGTGPQVLGRPGEFPWACWSPDARQIACLSIQGISFVDLATRQVVRTVPRKGFFQQISWSPDGRSILGVANSYGTGWSIARLSVATGEANAVNTVDCCTPDWFPDSQRVVFSWRPPGQGTNKGYGWTQLWQADAAGGHPQLIYAEDDRHVYGGHISPDGEDVLFTGNLQEDGDPGNAGAPMGLMRLKDAPIIGGTSPSLRAHYPQAGSGPVLVLPAGWEPSWTAADIFASSLPAAAESVSSGSGASLRSELRAKGWIAYSARGDREDWDLFVVRPDGSDRRRITDTREFNEAGVRFSPDGRQILYYRIPKAEAMDNNTYGTYELVLARADGTQPVVFGRGFNWASWSPDGRQLACLAPSGIRIIDVASRKVVRDLPRKGIVQQLVWSPDGQYFVGTANGLGEFWNIGALEVATGQIRAVSETERYNCTPDWCPDSRQIVYARGIIPQAGGRAELWVANVDGQARRRLYREPDRHIYGACASPDAKYLLFTRSAEDLGKVLSTEMAVIRWPRPATAEATVSPGDRAPAPERVDLGPGWEPHWTFTDLTTVAAETSP